MNVLFIETVGTSFVLTRGELLCPLVHWDPVIHYHPLGIALCDEYNFMLGKTFGHGFHRKTDNLFSYPRTWGKQDGSKAN